MKTNLSVSLSPEIAFKLQNYAIETENKISSSLEHILLLFFGDDEQPKEIEITQLKQKAERKKLELAKIEQDILIRQKEKEIATQEKLNIENSKDKWTKAIEQIRAERNEGKNADNKTTD